MMTLLLLGAVGVGAYMLMREQPQEPTAERSLGIHRGESKFVKTKVGDKFEAFIRVWSPQTKMMDVAAYGPVEVVGVLDPTATKGVRFVARVLGVDKHFSDPPVVNVGDRVVVISDKDANDETT